MDEATIDSRAKFWTAKATAHDEQGLTPSSRLDGMGNGVSPTPITTVSTVRLCGNQRLDPQTLDGRGQKNRLMFQNDGVSTWKAAGERSLQ